MITVDEVKTLLPDYHVFDWYDLLTGKLKIYVATADYRLWFYLEDVGDGEGLREEIEDAFNEAAKVDDLN